MFDRFHNWINNMATNSTTGVVEGTAIGGTMFTFTLWGLQLSDLSIVISGLASVVAVGIQFWVAREKVKALRKGGKASKKIID